MVRYNTDNIFLISNPNIISAYILLNQWTFLVHYIELSREFHCATSLNERHILVRLV